MNYMIIPGIDRENVNYIFLSPENEKILLNPLGFIVEKVFAYYDLPIQYMIIKTRKRKIVCARQVAHFFAWKLTKKSFREIGEYIGNKDHATVLHSKKNILNYCETDKTFKKDIDNLTEIFKNSPLWKRQ